MQDFHLETEFEVRDYECDIHRLKTQMGTILLRIVPIH
jgi:hypothetical protein